MECSQTGARFTVNRPWPAFADQGDDRIRPYNGRLQPMFRGRHLRDPSTQQQSIRAVLSVWLDAIKNYVLSLFS